MRLQSQKKENKVHHQKRIMCTYALSAKNLLLLQLLPDMSTTDACAGNNFACRMEFFGRQPTFRIHALLVEPASKAPKNLGESKANTNNPMVARAAERNGMQSNNKEARSMKTCNKKTGSQIITCRRKTTCPGNHLSWRKHQGSEGRLSSRTTPKNCLTCRLKAQKQLIFFFK